MIDRPRRSTAMWRWAIPALLLLAPLVGWPVGGLVWRALSPGGALSTNAVAQVAVDGQTWRWLGFTAGQALASTAIGLGAGWAATYVFSHLRFRGQRLLRAAITLPAVVPPVVIALAYREWLGGSGWLTAAIEAAGGTGIDAAGTPVAIIAAHACVGMAITVRLVSDAWLYLDPRMEEAARVLGAGRFRTFRRVTLPLLRPAIVASGMFTFVFAFTSFAIVVVLGGAGTETLEVAIARLARDPALWPQAGVLGLLQIVVVTAALGMLTPGRAAAPRSHARHLRRMARATWPQRLLVVLTAALGLLAVVLPLAALVTGAFTERGDLSAGHFAAILAEPAPGRIDALIAWRWSLLIALGGSAIALVLGGLAAMALVRARERRGAVSAIVRVLLRLPFAVPAVVLGVAYLATFDRDLYDLRGSPVALLLTHAMIGAPLVARMAISGARTVPAHGVEAAAVLGAAPTRAWRTVEWPVLRRCLLAGGAFAFIISLGETGAATVLTTRDFATVPVAIVEAAGLPGTEDAPLAMALATLLLAASVVAFACIERFRVRNAGEW